MDNYPPSLAPEFDAGGGVRTPFDIWWARAQSSFPTVPREVAQYWLHEHWGHSPFGGIPSKQYEFDLKRWPSNQLREIRSGWCDFDPANTECRAHGKHLETLVKRPYEYPTAIYMIAHGDFPSPIIVLDNRDAHVHHNPKEPWTAVPRGYVLMEGHRRFNLSLHLQDSGKLKPDVGVWLMTRRTNP